MSGTVERDAANSLFTLSVANDPHPAYRRIRQECPVARTTMGDSSMVLISRYDDVSWALRHSSTSLPPEAASTLATSH
jgi:cytochrome P450